MSHFNVLHPSVSGSPHLRCQPCLRLLPPRRHSWQPCRAQGRAADETWRQILEATASLKASVSAEDFKRAAGLRDKVESLTQKLSPYQQLELFHIQQLQDGALAEQQQSLSALTVAGSSQHVVAAVADALRNEHLVAAAEHALASIWSRHPTNVEINDLMKEGLALMNLGVEQSRGFTHSIELFTRITRLDPAFAEGWNKRATVLYLAGRFRDSIADCKKVLELQPLHFSAMTGQGLCWLQVNEKAEAASCFDQALQINPFLSQIRRQRNALDDP